MDQVFDIFRNDAFSTANLRVVARNVDFVPQALGEMALFTPHPIDTRFIIIYEEDGVIRLIPTTELGSPEIMAERQVGRFRALRTHRIAKTDSVRAAELTGVADIAMPMPLRLRGAAELVNERLTQLKRDKELTLEYHRMGALQGKLMDVDGTTILADYFAELGFTQPAIIDVNFATLTEEAFMQFFQDNFLRPTLRVLKDRKTPSTQLAALVGDTFWTKLMTHPGFREIYKLEMQARAIARAVNPLVQPNAWMKVDFGGVLWINYMGTDDGTTIAIPTNEARFFPLNTRDVFDVYYSPGETLDSVGPGVKGKEEYVILRPDPRAHPEFIDISLRTYPLHACIFPQALSRARIAP